MRQSSKFALWFVIALAMGLLIGVDARAQSPRDRLVDRGQASDFRDLSAGTAVAGSSGDWMLSGNGAISTSMLIPHDDPATRAAGSPYSIVVRAWGTSAGGVWPTMEIWVDGTLRRTVTVASPTPSDYVVTTPVRAGWRTLRIAFTNDAVASGADRNLFVRGFFVYAGGEPAGLTGNGGTFPLQSVSVLAGYFGPNATFFGTREPCLSTLTGCAAIEAVRDVGANDVTLTTVCVVQPGASWCRPQIANNDEEAALRVAIRHARRLGLSVTLKSAVVIVGARGGFEVLGGGSGWVPSNPAEFFTSLQRMLQDHARLARQEGVSLLVLGTEMGGRLTAELPLNDQCRRWHTVIDGVRGAAAATPGPLPLKLTYAPTLAGYRNDLNTNEAPYVCFWDRLDFIGLNAYHNMNFRGADMTGATPRALITDGWQAYRRMFSVDNPNTSIWDDLRVDLDYDNGPLQDADGGRVDFSAPLPGFDAFSLPSTSGDGYRARYATDRYSTKWYADFVIDRINERFKDRLLAAGRWPLKAILTEVGVPSSPHVHGNWGIVNPPWQWQPSWLLYVDQQALAWDGYLRAFRGDPRIHGISVWGVLPYRGRDWPLDDDARHFLVDHDFNGKPNPAGWNPTERRLCAWFKKVAPSGCLGP